MEHDIVFNSGQGHSVMRLIHGGGGSSYAISYRPQKLVESYQGGEKPNVLLVGHYHKQGYFTPREVHTFLAGCTKDQDSFLRKNNIACHVGGWTIEFTLDDKSVVTSVTSTWHPFFSQGYYDQPQWKYIWG